ncbi:uncharacterized protein [Palaemon carinicauda]|uniref:uncharacterized protein n=1 Tax=Palaemon carinicauda TaxID=392227 RepID=UPI0035B5C3CD
MLIIEVLARFPLYIRNRWKKYAVDVKRSQGEYPNFEGLVSFVEREVEEATDPVYGNIGAKMRDDNSKFRKNSTTSFLTGTFEHPPCLLRSQNHKLVHCDQFKNMKPSERVKLVRGKKLCENCLYSNHLTVYCRNPSVGSVAGCGKKHSKFLHTSLANNLQRNVENRSVVKASSTDVIAESQVFMLIVSVLVNKSHQTTALLDSASSSPFCSRDLIKSLGISGAVKTYKLKTMSKTNEDVSSMIVSMCVSLVDGRELINLNNFFVVDRIPVKSPSVNVSLFPHLKGLPGPLGGETVHILIGKDHAEALAPLEVRKGKRGEALAVRTILGCTLYGPAQVVNPVGRCIVSHFVSTKACVGSDIDVLWNIENDGISDNVSWSLEDREVIKLWDRECISVNGRSQFPIPWKSDVQVSNNYVMALSRLKATKRSLMKRSLFSQHDGEMQKLISKGYTEAVSTNVRILETKVWYLPHQAVESDKKLGKIRIVFDCSAKFDGEALNDKCLQGPILTNNLLYVLLRFHEHAYAVIADIAAMYYQVVIPKEDRDALHFI